VATAVRKQEYTETDQQLADFKNACDSTRKMYSIIFPKNVGKK
jgi:hypothetical protein